MFNLLKSKWGQHENESGFTLIELLVVILIIGILAAIAIPMFLNQRQAAIGASIQSDLKSTALAVNTYYAKGGSVDDLWAKAGNYNSFAWNAEGVTGKNISDKLWNDVFPDNQVKLSTGNYMNVKSFPEGKGTGQWVGVGGNTKFCIAAGNINASDYDYPAAQPLQYGRLTFYDTELGGVVSLKDIVKAVKDTKPTSCAGFGNAYIAAGGV